MTVSSSDVPLCDLNGQFRTLQTEIEGAISRVLQSGQVINGPEVVAFEEEIAEHCQVRHAIGCSSGSDALLLALAAIDVGPGDEVILPPFTFFATVGAVCRLGATPVFADIDPQTYNLDPREVESRVTSKTKAIIPVHLYGQCADMDAINAVAKKHSLAVIEDSAQAIGAEWKGKQTGSLGTSACFSFYPSKNLGTFGDAGLVTTEDAKLAAKIRALRGHGMEPKYFHKYMGWNARIDAIHAAILRVKLKSLPEWTANRRAAAARYDGLFEERGLGDRFGLPVAAADRKHVYNQYVIRARSGERDALVQHLKQNRIGCEIYYPLSLHIQECLQFLNYREGDFPVSEEASRTVLALPMFPEISEAQQARVVEQVANFARGSVRRAA